MDVTLYEQIKAKPVNSGFHKDVSQNPYHQISPLIISNPSIWCQLTEELKKECDDASK